MKRNEWKKIEDEKRVENIFLQESFFFMVFNNPDLT